MFKGMVTASADVATGKQEVYGASNFYKDI